MRFAAQENAIPGQIEVGAGAAPGADAIRADARRFRRLVASDTAQARTAALFAQGLPEAPRGGTRDVGRTQLTR